MRDIDDDSELEEEMRANEEQHSRKRVHADHMMDVQELMRERQQYQSIQETTKKVSLPHLLILFSCLSLSTKPRSSRRLTRTECASSPETQDAGRPHRCPNTCSRRPTSKSRIARSSALSPGESQRLTSPKGK